MFTYEITSDTSVFELEGAEIEGPQITWPGSVVESSGEDMLLVDPVSGTEYIVTSDNTLTAAQVRVIRNGLVYDVPGSSNMTVGEAYLALRADNKMTARQQDSLLVDKILGKLNSARRTEDTTEGQDDLSVRIIDALVNGTSFGNGQAQLDAAVTQLNPKFKDKLVELFMNVENRGQYGKALNMFKTLCGDFNRNVGARATERRTNAIVAVTPEQIAAWSNNVTVPTAAEIKAKKLVDSSGDFVEDGDAELPS